MLRPSWQLSATLAVVLVVAAVLLRPLPSRWARTTSAFAREFAIVATLLGLWQYVGHYVHTRYAGAMERAHTLAAFERTLHLPSEAWLQHLVLPFPDLVRAANIYYAFAHLNGMTIFLVWLWWRHRESYAQARNTVVASTLACLLVQIVPVAPPRLLPSLGFVDTAMLYGQSVYGSFTAGLANQLSAMPSIHVGWAVIVGWYAVRVSRSPWRWAAAGHAVLTTLVVVVTANHWWLDGGVAAGFVVVAIVVQRVLGVRSGPPAQQLPEPEHAVVVS